MFSISCKKHETCLFKHYKNRKEKGYTPAEKSNTKKLNCNGELKANINSDLPLKTAAIFFSSESLSKTGYSVGVSYD